jgi:site-specific recombinase XerD
LNPDKAKIKLPPDERIRRDRPYTLQGIQKMLSVCSRIREKTMIHLLTSTGMRIGALHTLKIGDLAKPTTKGDTYYITAYTSSSKPYLTPCSPECKGLIDLYLKERTDAGEVLKSESSLIRNLYNSLNVKAVEPLNEYGVTS